MSPALTGVRDRVAALPSFPLGFVQLCLLQAGVDRVDPTAGQVERLVSLLLLAFAVSGVVVALGRDEPPVVRTGSATAGLLLRSGLVLAALVLLAVVLSGGRLNPLSDLDFVVSLLLLALVTQPYAYDSTARVDTFLARWAVPVGLTALVVSLPVVLAKLLALP
ncbi:MAG: hypothetical protein JWN17_1343 [Frankiales bacterium]|nr:hypothetical protein [Frankiales bacterium]